MPLLPQQQAADELGGTNSAGRVKKVWGSCWEVVVAMGVVAMGVAVGGSSEERWVMGENEGNTNCTTQAMSGEQLRAFMEAVKADAGLQEKLNAAADADAVVAIAKAAGFVISAEELQRAQAGSEVSEEELEGVVGGGVSLCLCI